MGRYFANSENPDEMPQNALFAKKKKTQFLRMS